jgi:hypothetical protein
MEFSAMFGKRFWIAALLMLFSASAAGAGGWSGYANGRYAYTIDIPPGFSEVAESGNGDGGVSVSADGKTKLSVWGSYITEGSFADEIAWRIEQDKRGGWTISYDKRLKSKASWSGSKGNRILYARSVVGCDGTAVYFNIEYDRSQLKSYDPVVRRLVKSLRGAC